MERPPQFGNAGWVNQPAQPLLTTLNVKIWKQLKILVIFGGLLISLWSTVN